VLRKTSFIISFLFFFTCLTIHSVFCQEIQNTPTLSMSLGDALSIAFKNNKQIQIQEREIKVARANILDAQSKFLPKLNMDGHYMYNDAVLNLASTSTKKDVGVSAGYKNDNKFGFYLDETFFKGGAHIANWKQADLGFIIQQVKLRSLKLDVEFETKRLYYGLLLAYETERIMQNLLTQAQAHYMDIKNRFEQGTASRFDLLQAKIHISKIVPELVKATNAVDLIKSDLKKLLSIDIMTMIEPTDSLDYNPIEINESDFLKEAYSKRPEIILKELGIDVNRWSIEKAKAGYIPDIGGSASYSYRSSNLTNMFNLTHMNWTAGVKVKIPIFDSFQTKAEVDEAKNRYVQANLEKENMRERTDLDVRGACLDLVKAQSIVLMQRDSIEETKEALRITQVSYESGVSKNLDVLDAQVSLTQIEKNLCEGIYDYIMAKAYLYRIIGRGFSEEAGDEKEKD